jgi:heat shock protein 5
MKAAEIAGLKVLRVVNDPIAAALAYGRDKTGSESKFIVYDLGGGTFDVALLSIEGGVFKVLATAGDAHIGGEYFNNRVIDYLVKFKGYNKKTATDDNGNRRAMSKLKMAVELAKRTLSVQLSANIEMENFESVNSFLETLSRAKFEELNMDLFERTIMLVEQVLWDAEVTKSEVDEV